MINLPLVWDVVCVGLQERVIVSGECPPSKIRRVSARISTGPQAPAAVG